MDTNEKMFEDGSVLDGINDGSFDIHIGFNDTDTAAEASTDAVAEPAAEEPVEQDAPTTEQSTDDEEIQLTVKRDHREETVTVKRSELPTLWQKAQNMDRAENRRQEAQAESDRLRARMNKFAATAQVTMDLKGDTAEEVLDNAEEGLTNAMVTSKTSTMRNTDPEIAEHVIRSTLKDGVDEAMKKFGEGRTAKATEPIAETAPGVQPSVDQFRTELLPLLREFPDANISNDVIAQYKTGTMSLRDAYMSQVARDSAAEIAKLRQQNAVLQQNQASAKKAPVRGGVSSSGSSKQAENPIKAGFNDRLW